MGLHWTETILDGAFSLDYRCCGFEVDGAGAAEESRGCI